MLTVSYKIMEIMEMMAIENMHLLGRFD